MNSRKTFLKYVIPSVFSFALSGVYTVVDGFFVGNSLGDVGLSAINLAYPVAALIQALGTGIGLAGAIRYTIFKAQGKTEDEQKCFGGSILLLLIVGIIATGLILLLINPILHFLGAEGEILLLANDYVRIIAIGAVFQMLGTGLVPFVRNMGGATFAMVAMGAGFLTNIILDYPFVWIYNWGMTGAALATVIGQVVTMLVAGVFFARQKAKISTPHLTRIVPFWWQTLKMAFAPFGLTFSPSITLILMNRFLLKYGSIQDVAVYACIAYITSIVYLLMQGIGDGSQPLVSYFHGKKAQSDLIKTRQRAYLAGGMVAMVCIVGLFLGRNSVGHLFGASLEVNQQIANILPLFLCSLLFLTFVKITTSYFYATEENKLSYLLVYTEPILLFALLIILPKFMEITGVWAAIPMSQVFTWILSVLAKQKADRQGRALLSEGLWK